MRVNIIINNNNNNNIVISSGILKKTIENKLESMFKTKCYDLIKDHQNIYCGIYGFIKCVNNYLNTHWLSMSDEMNKVIRNIKPMVRNFLEIIGDKGPSNKCK